MSNKTTITISTESREKLRDVQEDRDCTAKSAIEQLIEREHRHITTQDIKEQILLKLIDESDYSMVNMKSEKDITEEFLAGFPDREDFVGKDGESQ